MSAMQVDQGIGTLWRRRVDSLHEYEIVRDGNIFGSELSQSTVYSSEYDQTRKLLEELRNRYQDVPFDEAFSGQDVTNDWGTCFCREIRQPVCCPRFDNDAFYRALTKDLTLVRGIGPSIQRRLNERGFSGIPDLMEHPGFRSGARQVMDCIHRGNSTEIMEIVGNRHSRSHPLALGTACLHELEDFVFFDIETLGLFSRPIILFGLGVVRSGSLAIEQFLLRNIAEEPAALAAVAEYLSDEHCAVVTFNGRSFDLPYLIDRLAYYGMEIPDNPPHFDVLHFSRRIWKTQYPSFRLSALEREVLGIRREDDIPGQMVPEFYDEYQRTGNCGPLVPVMDHNRQDVASLAGLFFHLYGVIHDRW